MPALPALSGREVVKAFAKDGWQMVRQRGSHMVMVKRATWPRCPSRIIGKRPRARCAI
jgi:predicted RNA binding protein YcfA (HicA-like mRNA interferase family)